VLPNRYALTLARTLALTLTLSLSLSLSFSLTLPLPLRVTGLLIVGGLGIAIGFPSIEAALGLLGATCSVRADIGEM